MHIPPKHEGQGSSEVDLFCTPEPNSENIPIVENKSDPVDACADMTRAMSEMCNNMQQMMKELRSNQDENFEKLHSNMSTLKMQSNDLLSSNLELKKTISEVMSLQKETKTRIEEQEKRAKITSVQSGSQDRELKGTGIEIKNLPMDNPKHIVEALKELHVVLQLDFELRDVLLHCLPAGTGQIRPIIVLFPTVQKKMDFLNAVNAYNMKYKTDILNTDIIKVLGHRVQHLRGQSCPTHNPLIPHPHRPLIPHPLLPQPLLPHPQQEHHHHYYHYDQQPQQHVPDCKVETPA